MITIEAQREAMLDQVYLVWALYELRKQNWLADHPRAKPDEVAAACRAIADELEI